MIGVHLFNFLPPPFHSREVKRNAYEDCIFFQKTRKLENFKEFTKQDKSLSRAFKKLSNWVYRMERMHNDYQLEDAQFILQPPYKEKNDCYTAGARIQMRRKL